MMYIDVPSIYDRGATLNVLIGGRRCGKTYGLLQLSHLNKHKIILMRRTEKEILALSTDKGNPYKKYNSDTCNNITIKYNRTQGLGDIYDNIAEESIGYTVGLMVMHNVRGMDFSDVTDIILDEFIPDEYRDKPNYAEGKALATFYDTVNSNREIEGKEPVRLWLLANPLNLNNPILDYFNLIKPIENMVLNNQQKFYDVKRSLYIYYTGGTEEFMKMRENSAITKMLGKDSEYYVNNILAKFTKQDFSVIKKFDLRYFKPVFDVDGKFFTYVSKDGAPMGGHVFYTTKIKNNCPSHYTSNHPAALRKNWYPRYHLYNDCHEWFFDTSETKFYMDSILD